MASSKRSKRTSKPYKAQLRSEQPQTARDAAPLVQARREGYDIVFDAATSKRMADIRQHGTKPELIVRHLVSGLGHRYRVANRDLPGSPDLANRARGWAIFVHGCYWHRHPACRLATTPTRNREFWVAKFERNVERDQRALRELRRLGFDVLVIWECQTREPEKVLRRLATWSGFRSE